MRLFASVVPPSGAVDHLASSVAAARERVPGLQWTAPERWHLTVAFFGEVEEPAVARLERRIGRAVRGVAPMTLTFAGAGRFGTQVLWVGVTGDVAALGGIAKAVSGQRAPYRPHLTVARSRRGTGDDVRRAAGHLATYAGPVWTAEEVLLVRSHLGPRPRHEPIARWPLEPGG